MDTTTNRQPNTLVSLATKKSKEIVRHEFTKEELMIMKDTIAQNLVKLKKKSKELKDFKDIIKAETKPLNHENNELLEDVVTGFKDVEMEVLLVPDYDNKIMEFYSEATGAKVGERRMLMSEFQAEINFPQ